MTIHESYWLFGCLLKFDSQQGLGFFSFPCPEWLWSFPAYW